MKTVFLLAGEPSGDLYAGLVARAMRELDGSVRMPGIGGPEMRAAGVELVEETSGLGVFGFWEGLTASGRLQGFVRRVKAMLEETRPDVFVPVSFSGVNLRLARFARGLGIKVVYLSPPQLWAWGKWRAKKLRRATDKVICLMPFEEPFFKRLEINAVFLGNPLVDLLQPQMNTDEHGLTRHQGHQDRATQIPSPKSKGQTKPQVQSPNEANPKSALRTPQLDVLSPQFAVRSSQSPAPDPGPLTPRLLLLPGSRPSEASRHLPFMRAVASRLKSDVPGLEVVELPFQASGVMRDASRERYSRLASASLALAASGTVTLEAALLGVPVVVVYRLSFLSYLAAKMMVRLKHFSLPNLLLDRSVVPEFSQPGVEQVYLAARDLLQNPDRREKMKAELAQIRPMFGQPGAALRIAREILAQA